MTRSIAALQNALPQEGMTPALLKILDQIVPGTWENITDFDQMITATTGEDVPGVVADIHRRAEEIFLSDDGHWNMTLTVYELVDTMDQIAAGATVVNKIGDLFGGLDFLKKYTPKPSTTQALDAGLKLITELMAFCMMHGMPSANLEGMARFVVALSNYGSSDLMRISAWVIVDGILPLGPKFMSAIIDAFTNLADSKLASHSIFKSLSDRLPGDNVAEKKDFILQALRAASEWVGNFISEHGITHELVKEKVSAILHVADDKLDYVAAAIDASTAYFTHTGTQTVARVLIQKAHQQAKEDAWTTYVNSMR